MERQSVSAMLNFFAVKETEQEPTAALSPPSRSDVLWTLNKNTATFEQIDTEKEAVEPINYAPKVAVAWSPEGSLAFAVKASGRRASYTPSNASVILLQLFCDNSADIKLIDPAVNRLTTLPSLTIRQSVSLIVLIQLAIFQLSSTWPRPIYSKRQL